MRHTFAQPPLFHLLEQILHAFDESFAKFSERQRDCGPLLEPLPAPLTTRSGLARARLPPSSPGPAANVSATRDDLPCAP